jgi:hypothetical protein
MIPGLGRVQFKHDYIFNGYIYISNVERVFDMLNNLHVWVFVKWELKELKLGVKESQVLGI